MIGLQFLHVKPALVLTIGNIDSFKGFWNGLDDHTTGLHLLSGITTRGSQLQPVLEPLKEKELTPDLLKALHKIWVRGADGGVYKDSDIALPIVDSGQEIGALSTASPDEAPFLTEKLLAWVNEALLSDDYHPLLVIAVFTAVFLQVSPFKSGNMRLAQFLVILLMMKSGYRYAPFASLEAAFDAYGESILEALQAVQSSIEAGTPDWQPWLYCFFSILNAHCEVLRGHIDDETNSEAITNLPDLSIALLESLRRHKRATMKILMKETKGRRSTIKLRMQELMADGLVRRYGAGRGVWYSLV